MAMPAYGAQQNYEQDAVNNAKAAQSLLNVQDKAREKIDDTLRQSLDTKQKRVATEQIPTVSVVGGELPSFQVTEILLKGCTRLSQGVQKDILMNYIGRPLNINDINQLISELTRKYYSLGYITVHIFLPKQNLKTGILEIQVEEGVLDHFIGVWLSSETQMWAAFPELKGKPVNVRDLEQGLEQLNRLPSNHVIMTLLPSDAIPGGTVVVIKNNPWKKTSGTVRFDNFQDNTLSIYPTSLDVIADNILSFNDQWDLTYSQRSKDQNQFQNSYRLLTTVGFGFFTPKISYSYFNYTTLIDGTSRSFISSGTNKAFQVGLDYVMHRDAVSKTVIQVDYASKDSDNYIEESLIGVNSNAFRDVIFTLQQTQFGEWGSWSGTLGFTMGTQKLKYTEDEIAQYPDVPLSFSYRKITGELNYATQWETLQPSVRISGQYGFDALHATQGFSVGDYASVRGFSRPFVGDSGLSGSVKISYPLNWAGIGWSLYHAVDAGVSWVNNQWSTGGRAYAASAVSGIVFRDPDWSLEGVIAKGVIGAGVPVENAQYYVSVVRFF